MILGRDAKSGSYLASYALRKGAGPYASAYAGGSS